MTTENLINITCKWLEKNQSKYIQYRRQSDSTTPIPYVAGTCLTDLRAFLKFAQTCNPQSPCEDLYYYDIIKEYEASK